MSCKTVLSGYPLINKEGVEILSKTDIPRYMNYMDYLIGNVFKQIAAQKGLVISDITDANRFRQIYDNAANFMISDLKRRVSSGLIDKTSPLAKKLILIHKNFDLFAEYHSKFHPLVSTENIIEDEDVQEPDEEPNTEEASEGDKKEEWDNTGNDKETYELASRGLQIMMRLLAKSRTSPLDPSTIEEETDEDGLPKAADFSSLWNNLALKLAGKIKGEDFFGTLQSPKLLKVFPEIKQINELLNLNAADPSEKQVQQISEFYKIFSRPLIKLYMSKWTPATEYDTNGVLKNDTITFFPQLKGNRNKVQRQFVSNFRTEGIPGELKQYTTKDGDFSEMRITSLPPTGQWDKTKISSTNVNLQDTFRNELNLLSLLGIKFTGLHLVNSPEEKQPFINLFVRVKEILHPNILQRLEVGQLLTNPAEQLQKRLSKTIEGNYSIIAEAINLESQYSSLSPTLMSKNADNEPQSDISSHNALSVAVYDLNQASSLIELFNSPSFLKAKYSPLFYSSKIIQHLFDKNGDKREGVSINVINYSGLTDKVTRNLTGPEKMKMDFNNMLQYGVTDTMRLETANSFYAIQLIGEDKKTKPHYPKNAFNGNFAYPTFQQDMLSYLQAELDRMAAYDKAPYKYPTTPTYGDFSVFSEILSPELKGDLRNNGITEENKPLILQAIEKNFNNQLDEFKSILNRNKVEDRQFISEGLKDVSKDNLIRSFLANSFVTNVDFSAVFSGESLFYYNQEKEAGDMPKRLKALSSTGNLAASFHYINNFLYNNERNKFWNSNYSIAAALKGASIRDNSRNFQTNVIKEDVSTENAYTSLPLQQGIQQSITLRDGTEPSLDDVLKSVTEGNKIKITDGQGRITLDFHKELSHRWGFWTPELDVAYRYEGLMFRKLNKQPYEQKELDDLTALIYSKDANKYAIPTLKATYFGPIENSDVIVDAKTYDKFSLAPLIPSHVHNHPELDALNKAMTSGQVGYIKYESATKAFVRGVKELADAGKDPDLQTTLLLKEQKDTKITQKTSAPLLTQTNKLLLANLFSEGKPVTQRVGEAYNKYFSTLTDIQKEQNSDLLDTLGFKAGEFSAEKIIESLQKEISRQKLPSTVVKALETVTDEKGLKKFKFSPEQSGAYGIINDYVSGLIDKTLRRYKVNSADFVLQTPSSLSKKLKFFEYDQTGTKPMECKITLTNHFIPLLNKLDPETNAAIGTIERLNTLLKNSQWVGDNKKALTVSFSRAPVQGQNSMGFATVEEFLSPTAGNVLILPDEFIAKAGVDFDIDVERVVMPQLTDRGDYVSKESIDQIAKDIEALEADYPELREHSNYEEGEDENVEDLISSIFKANIQANSQDKDYDLAVVDNDDNRFQAYRSYFYLKNLKTLSATNRLLENYINILSLPENFADLVIPNTNATIKALAATNATELGRGQYIAEDGTVKLPSLGSVYEYNKQLDITRKFFESKNYLGGYAIDNVAQPLAAQNNLWFNQKYDSKTKLNFETKLPEERFQYINPILFSPEQRAEIIKNGRVSMSSRFNFDKFLIQHYKSESINATVDGAKDPYHSELGIDWKTLGVFNFLTNMKLSPETAYDFVNLPVVKHYIELNKKQKKDIVLGDLLRTFGVGNKVPTTNYIHYSQFKGDKKGLPLVENPDDPAKGKQFYAVDGIELQAFSSYQLYPYLKTQEYANKDKYISPERLKELKDRKKYLSPSAQDKEDYAALLINFVNFENHSREQANFRRLFNYDTAKLSSLFEVNNKARIEKRILDKGMVSKEVIEQYKNHSLISPFINNEAIKGIYKQIFTVTNDPVVEQGLSVLFNEYKESFPVSQALLRVMPKILVNDFLKAVIDNFGEYKGQKLHDYAKSLIVKKAKSDDLTIVDRLSDLRKQSFYSALEKEYPILKQFQPDISEALTEGVFNVKNEKGQTLITKAHNISFTRNSTNIVSETESYISQLEKLISPDFKFQKFSDKANTQIQDFVKDLLITGYFQSGLNKSQTGFSDIIPTEFKLSFFPQAISKFQALSDKQKQAFIGTPQPHSWKDTMEYNKAAEGFGPKFYANNRKYFPEKATEQQRDTALRAKGYGFDLNQLQKALIPTRVETISPQKGFTVYKNALTQEQHDQILKLAQDQLKNQGYHVKKAVAYAHWGLMWAVNNRGAGIEVPGTGFPVFGQYLKKNVEGKIDLPAAKINSLEQADSKNAKAWYTYYESDQNGNPLSEIPQEVKDILQNVTGLDLSIYDAAIINAYADGTVLTRHIDNTEDVSAREVPIISINLLNPGKFHYGEGSKNSANTNPDNKDEILNNRDIAVFGEESRFMPHRVDVGSGNSQHFALSDGTKGIDARRINITLRRAAPISAEALSEWKSKNITSQQVENNSPAIAEDNNPIAEANELLIPSQDAKIIVKKGKETVVPTGSNSNNKVIFEDENYKYLMNDGQQKAYDEIKSFVQVKLTGSNNPFENKTLDLGNKTTFDNPLAKSYDGIIPQSMWDNMYGLIGKGGVGKTSLLKKIIDDLREEEVKKNRYSSISVAFNTPTHTAATVLQEALGVDSEGTKTGNVNTIASFTGRKLPDAKGGLQMISKDAYMKEISLGIRNPISTISLIVFDESSMVSKEQIQDVLLRIQQEQEEGITGNPLFLFMGDYRQLPDISSKTNPEVEGIISSTLFNSPKKSELTQIMRSSEKDMHDIFDAVGNQIEQRRDAFIAGKTIPQLSLTKYDQLTNQSSKNVLVVQDVKGVIEDYTQTLIDNNNPYNMFWVHYNRLEHPKTKELFNNIRKEYFKKQGITDVPEHFIKGDYIQYTAPLEIQISGIKHLKIAGGTIKPQSRYKVLDVTRDRMTLKDYLGIPTNKKDDLNQYFDVSKIVDVKYMSIYNRQDQVRGFKWLDGYKIDTEWVARENRGKPVKNVIITISKNGEIITKSREIPGYVYMNAQSSIKSLFANPYEIFKPSYIGSSHTAQGNSIKQVIVGDYNIKENLQNVPAKDISSSLYTALTRASKKLIIIKSAGQNIQNNQNEFIPYIEPKPIVPTQSNSDELLDPNSGLPEQKSNLDPDCPF